MEGGETLSHLIQISFGPVQSFIAASRKTRDLCAGSRLLQKLGQAAARSLKDAGAGLIFPPSPEAPAANILLATLDRGEPRAICAEARQAVLRALYDAIDAAAKEAHGLVDVGNGVLREQADKTLEWFAVWTPYGASDCGVSDYGAARRKAGELMASRKALRDFPCAPTDEGRPKSPLDPALPGVLNYDKGTLQVARGTDVRVKPREHLDALGLVKRFWGEERFPSTRRIACSDLIEAHPQETGRIEAMLKGSKADLDVGDLLFGTDDDYRDLSQDLTAENVQELKGLAAKIKHQGRPRPYYTVLHGDGDGMGKLLDRLAADGTQKHREFSRKLSEFSVGAPTVVEHDHGVCVFAGGDDVLALCPLETAIEIATKLNDLFHRTVGAWAKANAPDCSPTLTIGLGAVHVLDNLQEAVSFGRRLEKHGKTHRRADGNSKDALCVGARPRSGTEMMAGGGWAELPQKMRESMGQLENGDLPRGYPYEIRALLEEVEKLQGSDCKFQEEELSNLIQCEVTRIFQRKKTGEGLKCPQIGSLGELKDYADMLLVAHFFTREGGE